MFSIFSEKIEEMERRSKNILYDLHNNNNNSS